MCLNVKILYLFSFNKQQCLHPVLTGLLISISVVICIIEINDFNNLFKNSTDLMKHKRLEREGSVGKMLMGEQRNMNLNPQLPQQIEG